MKRVILAGLFLTLAYSGCLWFLRLAILAVDRNWGIFAVSGLIAAAFFVPIVPMVHYLRR